MLRGEPIGGVESPMFSLPVAALVQRALEGYVPGSPLPGRRELRVAAIAANNLKHGFGVLPDVVAADGSLHYADVVRVLDRTLTPKTCHSR